MTVWALLLLALGLAMDAFAVSICKGLTLKRADIKKMATCGIWFGAFQAIMPLIGYLLGNLFEQQIKTYDHWISFLLLALIGANMIREALSKKDECDCRDSDFSFKTMFTMAVATSIDAMAIGVTLALSDDTNIFIAILFIGVITCILSAFGVKIGSIFGDKFEKKAQFFGGAVLILLGVKILLEHLEILKLPF
jgi:putative Mn2+ efflux pump MntP